MKKITSFTVDHTKILPGLYISRKDGNVTTYDLRVKKPNAGDYMSHIEMHSLEHMFATYVRNGKYADNVLYFGPMGCQTGFYLLTSDVPDREVLEEVKNVLGKIIAHEGEVFGASEVECGNYRALDLEAAKKIAKEYLDILNGRETDFLYHC